MGRQERGPGRQDRGTDVLRHITALDGVRGTAIGLVLVFHLLWSNSESTSRWLRLFIRLRESAWVGVDLFYALSGFLITGILFESLGGRGYFRNFYMRRVLRILPLYYVVVLGLGTWLRFHAHLSGLGRPLALLAGYLNNTPLWFALEANRAAGVQRMVELTNHLWSLAVEEQFYLVWPFVIYAVRERRRLMWVVAGLALVSPLSRAILLAHGASFEETYKLTLCRADSLLGGAWLALAVRGPARDRILRWAPLGFGVGQAACLAVAFHTGNFDFEANRTVNLAGFSLVAMAAMSWVAMALRPGPLARVMTWRWLRFLGRYSFGIYVLHMPVAAALDRWVTPSVRAHIHSKLLLHLATMALAVALTIVLAMASFWGFEKRMLGLKRYFDYDRARGVSYPA